jgi:anti-sigma factor RsiW
MAQSNTVKDDFHQTFASLLPWYAQNTLDAGEHAKVEAHLAECDQCRRALGGWRALAGGVKAQAEAEAHAPAWAPSPAHFAKLAAQLSGPVAPRQPQRAAKPSLLAKLRDWFNISPPGMRVAFALQAAAIAVLAGVLWHQAAGPQTYETLSRAAPAAVSDGQLRVVFDAEVKESELRASLQQINASIVDGPSTLGVYTLQLSADAQPQQALDALRANPKVRFAEMNSAQR